MMLVLHLWGLLEIMTCLSAAEFGDIFMIAYGLHFTMDP